MRYVPLIMTLVGLLVLTGCKTTPTQKCVVSERANLVECYEV